MKQMILTGLATEQTFTAKGEAQFFLVFNHGELKVPTTEEAAQIVVAAMYGGQQKVAEAEQHEAEEEQPLPNEEEEEEEEAPEEQYGPSHEVSGSEAIVDEDGIAQI